MKRILILTLVLLAGPRWAPAAEPVAIVPGLPESKYGYTNGTLSLSSSTVTTIDSVNPGFREITIPNVLTGAATFYYRVDGSTQNIATTGLPVIPTATAVIETSGAINILLEPGQSAKTVRYLERRK